MIMNDKFIAELGILECIIMALIAELNKQGASYDELTNGAIIEYFRFKDIAFALLDRNNINAA